VENGVEYKFLELDDFCPDAAALLPPSVRVKTRVAFRLNRDTRRMAFHDSIEHAAYSSGVIPSNYEHNGSEFVLVAPWRKNLTFAFGASFGSGNLHDIRYAKRPQLPNLPCACILIGQPPADELEILSARGVGKDRNSRRYTAVHEIRCLQRARAAGIKRDDDDVRWRKRLIDDERPPCGSQKLLPDNENRNDCSRS
jgi:hypothetical protein